MNVSLRRKVRNWLFILIIICLYFTDTRLHPVLSGLEGCESQGTRRLATGIQSDQLLRSQWRHSTVIARTGVHVYTVQRGYVWQVCTNECAKLCGNDLSDFPPCITRHHHHLIFMKHFEVLVRKSFFLYFYKHS